MLSYKIPLVILLITFTVFQGHSQQPEKHKVTVRTTKSDCLSSAWVGAWKVTHFDHMPLPAITNPQVTEVGFGLKAWTLFFEPNGRWYSNVSVETTLQQKVVIYLSGTYYVSRYDYQMFVLQERVISIPQRSHSSILSVIKDIISREVSVMSGTIDTPQWYSKRDDPCNDLSQIGRITVTAN